jgi:very-short-patch-repair endonuclease
MIREAFKEEDRRKNENQITLKTALTPADWKKYKKEARKERNHQERKEQKKFPTLDRGKLHLAMAVEHDQYAPDETIPLFIKNAFPLDKEVFKIAGSRKNPLITYHCKRCNEDFSVYWNNYLKRSGHNCAALISSGEAVVASYLKSQDIRFLTQRHTLECINPDTGHVMPYDFEITDKKILIEVQGEQHRTFIERFHVDQEGFEYQLKKDVYKKEFAIRNGYKLVEIWYEDIENGKFKDIINAAIDEKPCTSLIR